MKPLSLWALWRRQWAQSLDKLKGHRWIVDGLTHHLTCEAVTTADFTVTIHCREEIRQVRYRWWPWPKTLITHHLYSVVGRVVTPDIKFVFDRIYSHACPAPKWTSCEYRQKVSVGMYLDWLYRQADL